MVSQTVQRIAELNDRFRRCDPSVPGQRFVTAGVVHLLKQLGIPTETLIQRVAKFDDSTEHNDPHGEHDFGVLEFHGHRMFWKIDAYDNDYNLGSDDPTELGSGPIDFHFGA